jgi:hypothetical protein
MLHETFQIVRSPLAPPSELHFQGQGATASDGDQKGTDPPLLQTPEWESIGLFRIFQGDMQILSPGFLHLTSNKL